MGVKEWMCRDVRTWLYVLRTEYGLPEVYVKYK